jgi:hypothetical protein
MAGVHYGVIVEAAEDPTFKIIHSRGEVLGRSGLAGPAREYPRAVPNGEVRWASRNAHTVASDSCDAVRFCS